MTRVITIVSVVLFLLSVQLSAQTKRALVIGLGEQQDKNWAKINGDKDVSYVKSMLFGAGYNEIDTLVNEQATKENIVLAFNNLAKNSNVGDIVYIHFSGHGQLVTDINGDESDGWDESWIPYDAYLSYSENDKGDKHLVDDEINGLLSAIRNAIGASGKLLVVVDACHSGDSTRGDEIDEIVRGVNEEFVIPKGETVNTNSALVEQWLTLSACKDYQLNQEMQSPPVGKLTYAIYSVSKEGEVTEGAVRKFMQLNRGKIPQTPELTGKATGCKLSDFFK